MHKVIDACLFRFFPRIVTVRMANYKISVLGEVNRPGTFTVGNEKVNILEALAMCIRDRDNIKAQIIKHY